MYAVLQQNVSTRWLLGVQPSKKIRTHLRVGQRPANLPRERIFVHNKGEKADRVLWERERAQETLWRRQTANSKFAEQTLAVAYLGRERKLAACIAEMQGRCGE